jgi:hypothetical protein
LPENKTDGLLAQFILIGPAMGKYPQPGEKSLAGNGFGVASPHELAD